LIFLWLDLFVIKLRGRISRSHSAINKVTIAQVTPVNKCDPPLDFDAKGDSTLTIRFHFKTKEFGFSTLKVCPGAHFISEFFFFVEHTKNNKP